MPNREVERSVAVWLSRARGDLQYVAFGVDRADLTWGTCFHAQQAAEKALKGYLVWLGATRAPRTHDLLRVAELVAQSGGKSPAEDPLLFLNAYAVECRYPEDLAEGEVTLDTARRAADYAREVVSFVCAAMAEDEAGDDRPAT